MDSWGESTFTVGGVHPKPPAPPPCLYHKASAFPYTLHPEGVAHRGSTGSLHSENTNPCRMTGANVRVKSLRSSYTGLYPQLHAGGPWGWRGEGATQSGN